MQAHYYNVDLEWKTARKGELSSPELDHTIKVATPPEFPNGIPGVWSPEHLYTAAVNSCFMTTFLAIAEHAKLRFKSLRCPAKGKLDQVEGKFMMTEVVLEPILTILDEKDLAKAEKILYKAEKACLITNSLKAAVTMIPILKIASPLRVH